MGLREAARPRGNDLIDITRALLDQVKAMRAKCFSNGMANRYMALIRAILRKSCNDWVTLDRVPKGGMFRDTEVRIRSLFCDDYERLIAEPGAFVFANAIPAGARGRWPESEVLFKYE